MRGRVARQLRQAARAHPVGQPLVDYTISYHRKRFLMPTGDPVVVSLCNFRMKQQCTRAVNKLYKQIYMDNQSMGVHARA